MLQKSDGRLAGKGFIAQTVELDLAVPASEQIFVVHGNINYTPTR